MSITKPEEYKRREGVDPRDQHHPGFIKQASRFFIAPLAKNIAANTSWVQTTMAISVAVAGIGELFGRRVSAVWYVLVFILIAFSVGVELVKQLSLPRPEETKEEKV